MTEVVWAFKALVDLNRIRGYVGAFSPLASQRLQARLRNAAEGLATFPNRGMSISRNRRQLATVRPYLIRYRITGDRVIILEIRHGAENTA